MPKITDLRQHTEQDGS